MSADGSRGSYFSRLNTPDRIRLGVALVLLAAACFFTSAVTAAVHLRETVRQLREDEVPTFRALQSVRVRLEAVDGLAARELAGSAPERARTLELLEHERSELAAERDALLMTGDRVAASREERRPLLTLNDDSARFFETMLAARSERERGDVLHAVSIYREAHERMASDRAIASDLERAVGSRLDQACAGEISYQADARLVATSAGVVLLLSLVILQVFLAAKTRRLLAPGMLAASALAVMAFHCGLRMPAAAEASLRSAEGESLASLRRIGDARVTAYRLVGDEDRLQLGAADESAAGVAFAAAQEGSFAAGAKELAAADGPLAIELGRSGSPGELVALRAAEVDLAALLATDAQLRRLTANGSAAAALELAIGDSPGGAPAVFARLDFDLAQALEIDQRAFAETTLAADEILRQESLLLPPLGLLLALATLLGARPRLREYAL